ncbi:DNA polymerase IV [Pseudemcibacter aquimaris]|uniref:DNA polymerase IV n=1 Tax=Pseudemcibacter aquimaris TaxID=2857064 RepID=UPI002013487B|nr:DNA polymerase IV [Pseudemcibacter aquimaris]MCC3860486.1 DNA polymerase IV [Pseudemcibacter aquimaris]WDU59311.1 DNA polymerase IV [Pseudemcibacter aquimaris]
MTDNDQATPSFCKDCLTDTDEHQLKCKECGSPRILSHPELHTLTIAHIDCDAFYASIEKRDNPDLDAKPLIIGGGKRGVVSTCCYIARTYGVRSAMPMFQANKLCPNAVVLKPNMDKYAAVSKQIREIFTSLTPSIEPISIDEAFIDLTGTAKLHGMSAAKVLNQTATRIKNEIGITVSIGLSYNKFLAKLASDLNKPDGFSIIGKSDAKTILAPMPINKIWGVGKVLNAKMKRAGISQIGQLQKMDLKKLIRDYGSMGERLYYFSRGEDRRTVTKETTVKSVSNEITLDQDVADYNTLKKHLWALSEKLSGRLKDKHISAKTITLKLKTANFRTVTRAVTLDDSTQMAEIIYEHGKSLLKKECNGLEYRLIGIGVSKFIDESFSDLPDLLDPDKEIKIKTEKAIDKIREKFGKDIINKGRKFT